MPAIRSKIRGESALDKSANGNNNGQQKKIITSGGSGSGQKKVIPNDPK